MDTNEKQVDGFERDPNKIQSVEEIRQWLNNRAKTALEAIEHEVEIDGDMPLIELGLDSLTLFTITGELAEWLNRELPGTLLFEIETINDLVTELGRLMVLPESDPTSAVSKAVQPRELGNATHQLSPEIHQKLFSMTRSWQGQRVKSDSLVFGLNTEGSKQPLYWCFQGFREFKLLASHLGPDQPVYGMRSGHLVMEYTKDNLQNLSQHYVREIRAVQPNGPYLLGGNCQSGTIAWEIAQRFQEQNETITLLAILDISIPRPYPGRIAFFFGKESDHNPHRKFHAPTLGWRKFYPHGFSLDEISGAHAEFFHVEENIVSLTQQLQQRIEQAKAEQNCPPSQKYAVMACFPDHMYQPQFSAPTTMTAIAGALVSIPVTVKNASSIIWPSTEQSGLMLGCHWLDRKGDVVKWLDGVAELSNDLVAGKEVQLTLNVTVPEKRGSYTLQLDMVDQGVTWFSKKGSEISSVEFKVSGSAFLTKSVLNVLSWPRKRAA